MSRASSRRGFLGHVAGACLATTALGAATAQPVDPVYVAMDAVRNNLLALDSLMDRVSQHMAEHGRMSDAMRAEEDAIFAAYEAASLAFLRTVPATKAGMLADLDFLNTPAGWKGCDFQPRELEAIRATFRAYVQREGGA